MERRKREKWVSEQRNVARCKGGLTGGEEEGGAGWRAQKRGTLQTRTHRQEGRMREESIRELGNMAHQRAHSLEGRKGRNALVSSEMWHIANKDSLTRGEEEGGGRRGVVTLGTAHVTNEEALPCKAEGRRAAWLRSERVTRRTTTQLPSVVSVAALTC